MVSKSNNLSNVVNNKLYFEGKNEDIDKNACSFQLQISYKSSNKHCFTDVTPAQHHAGSREYAVCNPQHNQSNTKRQVRSGVN